MTLTPAVLADLEIPRDVHVSSNGKLVTYITQTSSRKDQSSPQTSIWLAKVAEKHSSTRLTLGDHHDSSPRFSPDGEFIAFISDRESRKKDKDKDLYLIPTAAPQHLKKLTTTSEHGVVDSFRWSHDGSYIAFISSPAELENDVKVHDNRSRSKGLRIFNLSDSKVKDLFVQSADVTHFEWSDDDNTIAFCTQQEPEIYSADAGQDIMTVDVSTSKSRRMTRTPCRIDSFCWSEVGILACASYELRGMGHSDALHSFQNGEHKMIGYGKDNCARTVVSPWGRALVFVEDGLHSQIRTVDGTILYNIKQNMTNYTGVIDGDNTTLIVIKDSADVPPEVYSVVNGQECQLSCHGQHIASMELGKVHFVEYKMEGIPLDGYYCVPTALQAEFDAQKALPTVVIPHGGPYGRSTNAWNCSMMMGLGPYLLSLGYLLFVPNYRGGSGHGDDFASAVIGRPDISYEDVIWLVQRGVEESRIDQNLVAIMGWSQGGYITYLAVSRDSTFHFTAAVAGAGVSDWYLETCTADFLSFEGMLLGYMPWHEQPPDPKYREASPIYGVKQVRTPLLMIHGKDDVRVHVSNAILFSRALKHHGISYSIATYPREGHGVAPKVWERSHFIDYLERTRKFFDEHIDGSRK